MSTNDGPAEKKRKFTEEAADGVIIRPHQGLMDSDFGAEMLRVTIDDEAGNYRAIITYNVHRSLIHKKFPYFAATKNFEEGHNNHVTILGIDHDAFRQILNWIYAGNFRKDILCDADTFAKTWIAADRFMMRKCKNMAMDALCECLESTTMRLSTVQLIDRYGLSDESDLVQFVLDQYAWDCIKREECDDDEPYWPVVFRKLSDKMVFELMSKLIKTAREWREISEKKRSKPVAPADLTGCEYHQHETLGYCHLHSDDGDED